MLIRQDMPQSKNEIADRQNRQSDVAEVCAPANGF